ncbi:diaminopimelate epimerase [Nitrosomonas eutropha]|uniref:Diaminopimelate epimerase n=2 Tax=Nitrosomonas eutropha TaxID=916 RepID=DAPF_NITEC|nr:diaminopimelate epimerase [Nitrosomonas eutropha]Q0AIP0.1 RecName: Full=Diaminopimelate epimerase; Short=DAP epimerase; AltName: Full=PLP-independent amino acid racemase [Nitrosomonas eutropha C91]ABI58781.1 diaminopimelate epimerase [Nitrosomonas eutropha C91]PXV81176.1 diaminopimelate epimerase [Nitrosomonas eutropha]SCX03105.1 diaminopimelate epimerase [Nitrosomonas eutropha]
MKLQFTKMHGLGNDFIVINAINQPASLTFLDPATIRRLADRHFGIGFDQLLIVEQAREGGDFRYRIFNADGGEVEQCGNGARCFARFVRDYNLTDKNTIRVETARGIITPTIENNGEVSVNMGVPQFEPAEIPFQAAQRMPVYPLQIGDKTIEISAVSIGNPHAVQIIPDIDLAPVTTEGPKIEAHPLFPERVNAGFMQIIDRAHIRLRVFERGTGETLACGTGACAAVVCGILRGLLDTTVQVAMHGGNLQIRWDGKDKPVWMTGPAITVFEGTIDL